MVVSYLPLFLYGATTNAGVSMVTSQDLRAPRAGVARRVAHLLGLSLLVAVALTVAVACTKSSPAEETVQALAPQAPPPVGRSSPKTVRIALETVEKTMPMADGVDYQFWTFGGAVPGPMLRVRQGDTVELTLSNSANSRAAHNIDLHAVNGPGGGARATTVARGQRRWRPASASRFLSGL